MRNGSAPDDADPLNGMVGAVGFELTTLCSQIIGSGSSQTFRNYSPHYKSSPYVPIGLYARSGTFR
jgi:hypothetical protein